ncbi:MAG: hypothetical protein H6811_00685 [Phycisphaeraceae bacterium]|nr:hypothetical protein [Phycisphaeraceae bacterium]
MAKQGGSGAAWATWVYAMSAVIAIALSVVGAVEQNWAVVSLGVFGLVLVGASAPLTLASWARQGDRNTAMLREEIRRLGESIRHMAQEQALSDDARRVLNRARERELLCKAIEEDMGNEDWDAAIVLVRELAESFGYRAEAEAFRERIDSARFETMERRVGAAIKHLDQLLIERLWRDAEAEAARIARLYPDSPRVEGLRHRVHTAREQYKKDLERRFLHAAKSESVEEAMDLLEELDAYLTEHEAKHYQEVARGVIGKARDNLGAAFKLAVHDRRWREAAELGTRIIDQFPNTRMAEEVRSVIDGIRQKAATIAI